MKLFSRVFSFGGIFFCAFSLLNAQNESTEGSWGAPIPFDIVPVAVANLPDGNLITWSSQFPNTFVAEGDGMTYTELFDPLGNNGLGLALGSTVSATDHDMFCPGINNLADGRVLSAGGTSSERTSIYDWKSGTWEVASNMNIPRGYQANVTLSNGSVFTLGGSWSGGTFGNRDAEIWSENSGWSRLTGIQGSDLYVTNDFTKELRGLYRIDNHAWLWVAPDGSVFHAGPSEEMHWFDVTGSGTVQTAGNRANDTYSMKGTTVMFDAGKLLKVGGAESYDSGHEAKDASYVIDINGGFGTTPTIYPVGNNLSFPRTMHNSTVLPNGEVLVTGGLSESVLFSDIGARMSAEIYNPVTNLWRTVAGMQVPRTYHSVSILMADARVFVGGGGLCDSTPGCENHFNAEIYSPPYLFDSQGLLANRPSINAPEATAHNTTVRVTGTTNVQQFSLIRNSSATHSTNNEQRRIPVNFTVDESGYLLQIPNENMLPPGYYMLFAMDAQGVPSVAEIIKIGPNSLLQDDSLLVHLDFEETSGTVLNNLSGTDSFTVAQRDDQGNPVAATEFQLESYGVFGNAIELDGKFHNSNTILEADFSTNLNTIADEITVSAWVFRNESSIVAETGKVANVGVFAHDYPAIFAGFHNSLLKWSFGTSNGFVDCYAGYAPLNQWVHIAVTYDGETAKLFSNGIEICSKAITGQIELRNDESPNSKFTVSGFYEHRTNLPVVPYGNSSGITDELDGRLDDFRVYNQALSNFQIRTIYEEGLINGEASIADCRDNLIVPEYKVGNDGDWIEGTLISAPLGSEVFIRAKNHSQEYFITTPEYDGPTFSSQNTSGRLTSEGAYQIDTYVYPSDNPERNDGLIGISNTGQYALTTANGCATIVELKILRTNENCTGTLIPEYRLNGVWFSGVNDVSVSTGDELIFSMLPNNIDVQIELPNGRVVEDNYTIGSISSLHAGTYVIFSSEGCVDYLNVGVNSSETNQPPEARAQANRISGFYPLLVSFDGNASTDDSGIESYIWTFGDGSSSNLSNPEHTYLTPGVFNATLTVEDVNGVTSSSSVTINVLDSMDFQCDGEIIPEYRLDGVWLSGDNEVSVAEGTEVLLSMLPNGIGLEVEFPDGRIFGDNISLGTVDVLDSGLYTLRSEEGCITTLLLTVGSDEDADPDPDPDPEPDPEPLVCDGEISPEYRLNGVWSSGENELSVAEGTEVLLSMLPNGIGLEVEFPDGRIFDDNISLGTVDVLDSGLYTLRSEEGCITTILLTVGSDEDTDPDPDPEPDPEPLVCDGEISPEYRLNGVWSSGENELSVAEGTEVLLSMLPNGIGLEVEFPDGRIFGDNISLGTVDVLDSGLYTLRSEEGCITTILLTVGSDEDTDPDPDPEPDPEPLVCDGEISPEYRLNGVWSSGENELSVAEGTEVLLSMLPNGIGLEVEFPDGRIFGDNVSLGTVDVLDSGSYTLRSEEGCSTTINLSVTSVNLPVTLINLRSSLVATQTDIDWGNGLDTMNEYQMMVSPNPATVELSIVFSPEFRANTIEVYDTAGRRVQFLVVNDTLTEEHIIDIRTMVIGTYYVIATDKDGKRIAKQIIVQ